MWFVYDLKTMKNIYLLLLIAVFTAQCTGSATTDDEIVKSTAQEFAASFFNYDFSQAETLVTPESGCWVRYAASNVRQSDVDFFNTLESEAAADVVDIEWTNDTTARVGLEVSHVALRDSIEGAIHLVDNISCTLDVVLRDGQALVRMASPLRSEKQSRD